MKIFLLALLSLCACAPAPKVLRGHVVTQRALAEQAAAQVDRLCQPPPSPVAASPEPKPGPPPPRCEALLRCLEASQQGARRCVEALKGAGTPGYRAAARACAAEQSAVVSRCRAADIQPRSDGGTHAR